MSSKFRLRDLTSRSSNPLARILLAIIAILVMVPYEFAKTLSDKAYSGWVGAFRAFIGFCLGVGGGIASAHYVGWTHGWPLVAWLPAGILGYIAVQFYLFPILHIIVLKPAWDLADWVWDAIRDFAKNHFEKLTVGYIRLVKKLPLASIAWDKILGRSSQSWLDTFLTGVSYVTSIIGSGYLGWSIFKSASAYLVSQWGAPVVVAAAGAGFLGFLTAVLVVGVLVKLLEFGKIAFVSMASGAALIAALAGKTQALVLAVGLNPAFSYAAYALEFILFTAYAFPVADALLTDGLKWLYEKIAPMVEKVYDGEEKTYRQFFHSLVNIAVALILGGFALHVTAGTLALPALAAWPIAAVVALLSYTLVFKAIDLDGGNIIIGLVTAAGAAWKAFALYTGATLPFGIYGGIAAAVLSGGLTFLLLFPLAYIIFRFIASRAATKTGAGFVKAHGFVYEGFKKLMKELAHCYDYGYNDKTDDQKHYRELFLHLMNIAGAVGAVLGTITLANALGFALWATIAAAALAVALSYTLVGKLILKAGTELVGAAAGLTGGIFVGGIVHGAGLAIWLSVAIGIAAAAFTFAIAFPIVYVIVRVIGQPVLTGWLRPILVDAYNWCWARVVKLWEQFVSIYKAIRDFLAPYWQKLVRTWQSIWKSIKDTWASIRGKS